MLVEIGVLILLFLTTVHVWFLYTTRKDIQKSIHHKNEQIADYLVEIKTALLQKEEREKLIKTLETNLELLRQSSILASKQKEYKQFFSIILNTILEDTKWLRSSLFQRFGEVPEFSEINSQIIAFETKIEQIKLTLKEYRMLEDYDE